MTKRNTMRDAFAESETAALLAKLEQRDWTLALLQQELRVVENKLSDGDVAVLDNVGEQPVARMDEVSTPTLQAADAYAEFFSGAE